ncbi:MAG: GNAT family N-acetyltransferase [Candidatus Margulisbacteria bacterium]|jgi:RimJ/RimL family protein N-acetyltransferase|nr:GNAT family N-acetyltransferase [Candidatus Margulisiibacteriota bacterium]
MPRLNGSKTYLEPVKPQNLAQIRGWSIKTRDSFFLNKTTLMVSTDDLAILTSSLNHQFYMLYAANNNTPLGVLLFSNIHNPRHIAEVSLTMQPSQNNTKLLRDALETGLNNLFTKGLAEKIYCHCLPHEEELKKVLLDCRFKKEGQLKEHLFFNNKYHDQEIFGLPKKDYYQ